MKSSTTTKSTSKRASTARRPRNIKASQSTGEIQGLSDSVRQRVSKSLEAAAKIDRTQLVWGLAGTAAVGAGAYFLYRSWSSGNLASFAKSIGERFGRSEHVETSNDLLNDDSGDVSTDIPAGLPLGISEKKPSPSIRDHDGNYDMDGVSYDVQGVVVGSDNHKGMNPHA